MVFLQHERIHLPYCSTDRRKMDDKYVHLVHLVFCYGSNEQRKMCLCFFFFHFYHSIRAHVHFMVRLSPGADIHIAGGQEQSLRRGDRCVKRY